MATVGRGAAAASALGTDVDEVRRIVLQGLGALRARVWLFGSRARGDAGRPSDIDVAILPLEPFPDGTLARIAEALENSLVLHSVDLVDLSTADPELRDRVEREGIPWTS
jgi:predicted nucleotidyltransferase